MTRKECLEQLAQAAQEVELTSEEFKIARGNLLDSGPYNYNDCLLRYERAKEKDEKTNERFHRLARLLSGE